MFVAGKSSQPCLTFVSKSKSPPLDWSTWKELLLSRLWPYSKTLDLDKHSSLLQTFVNYGQKSFVTLAPGRDKHSSLFQTFVNYRQKSFVILAPGRDKHSSLFRTFVNYRQKSFNNIGPCHGKHSSLLRTFVNYERKKFNNIGPWSFTLILLSMLE